MSAHQPKIGILVVAFNAASSLASVLDRIPQSFRPRISEILVCDDHSRDSTYLVGLGYQQISDLPLTVIRHPQNLGYGGNQKVGYQMAIDHGLDVIVMLHGDGQYAPEIIADLVDPLVAGAADAVFGSRMMVPGDARKGGMPLYKYVGNRVLTGFQNGVLGTHLSEFHSGYRAYSVAALQQIAFRENSDGFDFDTQIILQLLHGRHRILEVPIPTYYGDEICYVDGMKYARDVAGDVVSYKLGTIGLGRGGIAGPEGEYRLKKSDTSSHGRLIAWMAGFRQSEVLDLGCSGGLLAEQLRKQGHTVTGIELEEVAGAAARVDRLVIANLEDGIPAEVGDAYDVAIAGDVLEHVSRPEALLEELRRVVRPGGSLLVSVPNFGHWYVRARVAAGLFDYDNRGILDRGHLRFFTRRSFRRLLDRTGWEVSRAEYVGLPFDLVARGALVRAAGRMERRLVWLRPTLFSYQLLFHLRPKPVEPSEEIHVNS